VTVIEVSSLRRTYRSRISPWRRASREVEAVRGIDFAAERGELFGLLRPNGAGKTTPC
jgi:ABC-2 type transport system ATP-binding protein